MTFMWECNPRKSVALRSKHIFRGCDIFLIDPFTSTRCCPRFELDATLRTSQLPSGSTSPTERWLQADLNGLPGVTLKIRRNNDHYGEDSVTPPQNLRQWTDGTTKATYTPQCSGFHTDNTRTTERKIFFMPGWDFHHPQCWWSSWESQNTDSSVWSWDVYSVVWLWFLVSLSLMWLSFSCLLSPCDFKNVRTTKRWWIFLDGYSRAKKSIWQPWVL